MLILSSNRPNCRITISCSPAPTSSLWNDPTALLTGSLSIGFVAILETLISGKIADGITRTSMNQRRECMAVGLANIACGLAGGLPTTAALARTALNVKSGAQSRVAGVLGGLATIFIAFVALPFFEYLPMPVVAAMLIQVASGMIEFHGIIRLIRLDFVMLCHTIIVIVVCLVEDPTAGIVVGCLMGLVRFAQNVSSAFSRVFVLESHSSNSSNSKYVMMHQCVVQCPSACACHRYGFLFSITFAPLSFTKSPHLQSSYPPQLFDGVPARP